MISRHPWPFRACATIALLLPFLLADTARSASTLSVDPPDKRQSRLSKALNLTEDQESQVREILDRTYEKVKTAIAAGNKDIRELLDEDQVAYFDRFLKKEKQGSSRGSRSKQRLKKVPNLFGVEGSEGRQGRGAAGGQGQGGGMRGPGGPMGGGGMQGGAGGQGQGGGMRGPGGPMGGGGMQGGAGGQGQGGGTRGPGSPMGEGGGRCGDGICQPPEQQRGLCPDDCD